MLVVATVAIGAPVADAVRLYSADRYTCAVRATGDHVCWGGEHDRAVPASRVGVEPPGGPCRRQDERTLVCEGTAHAWPTSIATVSGPCALGDGQVYCVGKSWRMDAGMPPGTPTDRPVHVPLFDGADALFQDGTCILREGTWGCARLGALATYEDAPRFVRISNDCAVTADDQPWCRDRTTRGLGPWPIGPVATFVGDRRQGLARRPDGQVVRWTERDGEEVPVPIPSSLDGEGSLVRGRLHECALSAGRIGCWGSDRLNERGDGGGRSLAWSSQPIGSSSIDLLPCSLVDGRVQCEGDAPWGPRPLPPVDIDDVAVLEVGRAFGCAITHDRDLVCFGETSAGRPANEPLLKDVIAVSVTNGLAALGADGTLYHHGPERFVSHGRLPGATRVVGHASVSCAIAPDAMLCVDARGPVLIDGPHGALEVRDHRALCEKGTDRCLTGSWLRGEPFPTTDVTWVEAGW